MLDIQQDIKWSLFSEEEKEKLIQCFNDGDYLNLTCLPYVSITPEKEAEIQKMVFELRVIQLDDESDVKKEINEFWSDSSNEMTPEKEAEFQAKLDSELKTKNELLAEKKAEGSSTTPKIAPKQLPTEAIAPEVGKVTIPAKEAIKTAILAEEIKPILNTNKDEANASN